MADAGDRGVKRIQAVFWHRDLGTFVTTKSDWSDLGGPYLEAAIEDARARGKPVPDVVLERLAA